MLAFSGDTILFGEAAKRHAIVNGFDDVIKGFDYDLLDIKSDIQL